MNTFNDLNANEISVLKAISLSSKDSGGDFTDFQDTMKLIKGLTKQQVKGYLSQLSQKGYVSVEEESNNPMICAGKYVNFLTHYNFN